MSNWIVMQTLQFHEIIGVFDGTPNDLFTKSFQTIKTPMLLKVTQEQSRIVSSVPIGKQVTLVPLWDYESDEAPEEIVINMAALFSAKKLAEPKIKEHAEQLVLKIGNERAKQQGKIIDGEGKTTSITDKVLDKYTPK